MHDSASIVQISSFVFDKLDTKAGTSARHTRLVIHVPTGTCVYTSSYTIQILSAKSFQTGQR